VVQSVGASFAYSRWDGTQHGVDVGADDILRRLGDDLLYHGDPTSALARLMREGMAAPDGRRIEGLREIVERLRRRGEEIRSSGDLGGVYHEIAEDLAGVIDDERREVFRRRDEARVSGDERRAATAEASAAERDIRLNLLPDDLAGRVAALQTYDFESAAAQRRFDELVDRLRQQVIQHHLDRVSSAVDRVQPGDLARMKDMLAALNEMLDRRAGGEDPRFEEFMKRFGDFFPDRPDSLDELLEHMAKHMAAARQMLASMTPEQRDQLQRLSDQLLEDLDLRWQMEQLANRLQSLHGELDWSADQGFSGEEPLGFSQAMQAMRDLQDIDTLSRMLSQASSPAALSEIDRDRVAELAGPDAAQSLAHLAELTSLLEEAGLIDRREGRLSLTPGAIRRLGAAALRDLFGEVRRDLAGHHAIDDLGVGHERAPDSRPYQFGDPFNLDLHQTLRNAVRRGGPGLPVRLSPDDFDIEQMEHQTRASTVVLLDLSMSMPMRGNFLPAKKVAIALHHLISTQFPRDYLGLVGFGETARELRPEALPEASWDFAYGTNMHHALALARRLLDGQGGSKQVIMVTDGEPTAHVTSRGDVSFHYPPTRETIEATLGEVRRCTRAGITINTFMLDADSGLQHFVEKMATINGGRAFFTTHETLGGYVLVDFLEHRRRVERRGRRAG